MKLRINKSNGLEELVRGCKNNREKAQRELFERYSSRMLGICRRYVVSLGDAEDIMVNGFMKVFEKIDQYKGEGSFEGWMTRIMINESLSFIRRNKNMSVEVSIDKADKEPDYTFAHEKIDTEQLLGLIDELPVGYKTVFNLYVVEGYSHKEISELLNITEGASKSQLSRAKSYLRNRLGSLEQELNKKSHENR